MSNIKQNLLSLPQKAQEFFIREENIWIYEMISKNFPGPETIKKIAGIYYATMATVTFGIPYLIGKKLITNMINNFKKGFTTEKIQEELKKDIQNEKTNIQALPDPTSKQYQKTEQQKIHQEVDKNNNTINQNQIHRIG